MDERVRVQFTRDGMDLPISHLGEEGITFAFESSARPLGIGIGLTPANGAVAARMKRVRQIEDWAVDAFKLAVTRDGESLVISGAGKRKRAESLPPGNYTLRFVVSETRLSNSIADIEIPEDGEAVVSLHVVASSNRLVVADRSQWDAETRAVCEHPNSRIDGMDPLGWISQPQPRIARKACLLNLLAKARSLPSARVGESLCSQIESVRWADVDRIAVTAAPGLLPMLRDTAGWRDTGPIHPTHAQNLARVFGGSANDYNIESFREPVAARSLQVVCATHRTSGRVFADLDIDLGHPGIDLTGLIVHIGELLDPSRTNHLDLFGPLAGGSTHDFLYYRLEEALARPATK